MDLTGAPVGIIRAPLPHVGAPLASEAPLSHIQATRSFAWRRPYDHMSPRHVGAPIDIRGAPSIGLTIHMCPFSHASALLGLRGAPIGFTGAPMKSTVVTLLHAGRRPAPTFRMEAPLWNHMNPLSHVGAGRPYRL